VLFWTLTEALKAFTGGLVLISHDARLIKATECDIWVCDGGADTSEFSGLANIGLRLEGRGFARYRSDVIKQIERRAAALLREAESRAVTRKEQRERRIEALKGRAGPRVGR
jgi:hypothetical protein